MRDFRPTLVRAVLLVGGILASQFILFGPSLIGRKVMLPVDTLALPGTWLSPAEEKRWGPPFDAMLTDPTLEMEIDRRFAVSEIRAGRLPLWNPHEYCGQPFLAANQTAVFSPFRIPDYLWPGTLVIAWDQVFKALVAGVGAYFFFRVALGTDFLPALFAGWIWPLCGYYIQWVGHPLSSAAVWLPWIFLCTDGALRRPGAYWIAALSIVTGLSLISGHAATAAQVLLADGVFFLWRAFELGGRKGLFRLGAAAAIVAWILGAMLSAPQSLPTLGYLQTSHRMQARLGSEVETPPAGPSAIPQLVLPDFNGATRDGNMYFGKSGNLLESPSSGYIGLITALVLVPLAFANRRRRSWLIFSIVLAIIGLGQIVPIPGLKSLYASFPLDAMRQNRMVLATAWAILIAGVLGLETLLQQLLQRRWWLWLAAALPLALGIWCLVRAVVIPQGLRHVLTNAPEHIVADVTSRFSSLSFVGAELCVVAVAAWVAIILGLYRKRVFVYTLALVAIAEVLYADFNVYPLCAPLQYYPAQPLLADLAHAPPGRVCGVHCFPACLTELAGLLDVRGYDASDPSRLVDLCYLTQPRLFAHPEDAAGYLQDYFPAKFPSPLTRLMNLRYLIFTGNPPPQRHPKFTSDGYWVYEDRRCPPRVYIPKSVQVIQDPAAMLKSLARPDFDPLAIAYSETPTPAFTGPADGEAAITQELPRHLTIDYTLQTPGIVVISDSWDAGWHAKVNGVDSPVLRMNHAFRGVAVPAGKGVIEYDYEPASFYLGLTLAGFAAAILAGWMLISMIRQNRKQIPHISTANNDLPVR